MIIKIAAISLVILLSAGFYFFNNYSSSGENIPVLGNINKENSDGKKYFINGAPLSFIDNPQLSLPDEKPIEQKKSENQENSKTDTAAQNLIQSLTKEIFNPLKLSTKQSDIPYVPDSELNIESAGAKNSGEYYEKFLMLVKDINFYEGDFEKMKKGEKERVLSLEELIEKAVLSGSVSGLEDSFSGWRNLDGKAIKELKKIPVYSGAVSINRSTIGWYQYHYETAEKFSKGNLSKEEIIGLQNEFKKNAGIHVENFKKSLAKIKNTKSFSFELISKANAFTCGAFVPPPFYHIGGRVLFIEPCNFGLVIEIGTPCGGVILFNYLTMATNPYLWHNTTYGAAIIGRSLIEFGACPLGVCPYCTYFYYAAIVLYFGTSSI